jgi:hypothetical protein
MHVLHLPHYCLPHMHTWLSFFVSSNLPALHCWPTAKTTLPGMPQVSNMALHK